MGHQIEWTDERPTEPGEYWAALHPDQRDRLYASPPVMCATVAWNDWTGGGLSVRWFDSDRQECSLGLDDLMFDGAKWSRRETPADPFAEQPKLSPATEIRGEDARRLLESLVDVASPEEVARRRAVSRERLSRVGASKTTGLEKRYNVNRVDGKPIKCGCIVLEFDDSKAQPALLVWADSMEAAGYAKVAADVRAAVNDANLFHFMPDGTRILKNPQKPSSRDSDLP